MKWSFGGLVAWRGEHGAGDTAHQPALPAPSLRRYTSSTSRDRAPPRRRCRWPPGRGSQGLASQARTAGVLGAAGLGAEGCSHPRVPAAVPRPRASRPPAPLSRTPGVADGAAVVTVWLRAQPGQRDLVRPRASCSTHARLSMRMIEDVYRVCKLTSHPHTHQPPACVARSFNSRRLAPRTPTRCREMYNAWRASGDTLLEYLDALVRLQVMERWQPCPCGAKTSLRSLLLGCREGSLWGRADGAVARLSRLSRGRPVLTAHSRTSPRALPTPPSPPGLHQG
jgi:hypothetical protein